MQPGGSLIINSSSMRVHLATRHGRVLNYLNTNTVSGAWNQFSGIAIDPGDGSVWTTCDTTGAARVWNYTKGGALLSTFAGAVIDPSITELEGIAVSPDDYTLYLVDDSPLSGVDSRLWHCKRDGTPLAPFVDLTPLGIQSAQDIEYDRLTDTLLVICNVSRKVYRLDLGGALIGSTSLAGLAPQPNSWQGIAVDLDNGDWWISGYSHTTLNVLVRIDPATMQVKSTISTASFPSMGDIAGIAYDPRFDKQ